MPRNDDDDQADDYVHDDSSLSAKKNTRTTTDERPLDTKRAHHEDTDEREKHLDIRHARNTHDDYADGTDNARDDDHGLDDCHNLSTPASRHQCGRDTDDRHLDIRRRIVEVRDVVRAIG